jgi:hypothetical protein
MAGEELTHYIRAVAEARGIRIDEAWLPGIEAQLKRLLDAAAALDRADLEGEEP